MDNEPLEIYLYIIKIINNWIYLQITDSVHISSSVRTSFSVEPWYVSCLLFCVFLKHRYTTIYIIFYVMLTLYLIFFSNWAQCIHGCDYSLHYLYFLRLAGKLLKVSHILIRIYIHIMITIYSYFNSN